MSENTRYTPENAKTWRDLTDQLTPEQIAGLEESERDPYTIFEWSDSFRGERSQTAEELRDSLLIQARGYARDNVADILFGDVLAPAGAGYIDAWQPASGNAPEYRTVGGTNRTLFAKSSCSRLEGHEVTVWNHLTQFADGTIDVEGRIEKPGVSVSIDCDRGVSSDVARLLAATLIEAADEVDGWSAR